MVRLVSLRRFVWLVVLISAFALGAQQAAWGQSASGQPSAGAGIAEPSRARDASASSRVISFAGVLPEQPDGAVGVTFSIYPDQQSTSALWTETQTIEVSSGKYTALLGSSTTSGLPPEIFGGDQAHWLGVRVNGSEKRYLLVSVPYAINAINAQELGGVPASQYATVDELRSLLRNSVLPTAAASPTSGSKRQSAGTPAVTPDASVNPPQPATDFTDNNASEVLLVTQQGTGFAIHAISSGDAALFAENSNSTGTAIKGSATSTDGHTIGIFGTAASPDGIPGVFDNASPGRILSLRSNAIEVARFDQNGLTASQVTAGTFAGSGSGLTNIPVSALPPAVVIRDSSGSFGANQIVATLFTGSGAGLTNIPVSALPPAVVIRDNNGSFGANQIVATLFTGSGAGLTNIPVSALPQAAVTRDTNGNFGGNQIFATLFTGSGAGLTNIPVSALPQAAVTRDSSGNFGGNQIFATGLSTGSLNATGFADFTSASKTAPIRTVLSSATPTSCLASKELLIKTDALAGQQLFICNSSGNGYVLVGDGAANGVTSITAADSSIQIGGTSFAPTVAVANGGVTNNMLQNRAISVLAGNGLTGGGSVQLGDVITLNNAGVLSFNGRTGSVIPTFGDYSFNQLFGAASPGQLPASTVYANQSNTFLFDQTINGKLTSNSVATGALTGTSVSIVGAPSTTTSVVSVTDSSPSSNGSSAAVQAYSRNNPAGLFLGDGAVIFSVGSSTHGILTVNNAGMSLVGNMTASAFNGDGSALTNVNAAKVGGLATTDLASNTALNSESNARQSADSTLQANINTETTARQAGDATLQANLNTEAASRQSDEANLQSSINGVSAADAKLAASNTFTAGTQDFSGAGATLPVHAVLSTQIPATCVASKELLIETDAPGGQQLFICNAAGNGWNLVGDGAAGGVASFNGRGGSVTTASGDYSFNQISGSVAASQMPAFSGDITSTAGGTTTTLSNTGVTAGTFTKITVDVKGRATSGAQAAFSDLAGGVSPSQLPAAVVYNNQSNAFTGNQIIDGAVNAASFSGSGAGLTNVNAVALNGLASTSFAQLATPNTFTAKQTLAASSTASASLNLPAGAAPTTPSAGDVWNTGAAIQYSDNASTTHSLVSTSQSGGMQMLKFTASITPMSVPLSTCSEQSFGVPGVISGDVLLVVQQPSGSSPGPSIAIGGWRIPTTGTVAIQFCNVSRGSSHLPAGGIYTFAVMR
jgi:hypothetical protein